jgi:hypothetical protein
VTVLRGCKASLRGFAFVMIQTGRSTVVVRAYWANDLTLVERAKAPCSTFGVERPPFLNLAVRALRARRSLGRWRPLCPIRAAA